MNLRTLNKFQELKSKNEIEKKEQQWAKFRPEAPWLGRAQRLKWPTAPRPTARRARRPWRDRRRCSGGRTKMRSSPRGRRDEGGGTGHGQGGRISPAKGVHGGATMAASTVVSSTALASSDRGWQW
jgi:hypothetical protein